MENSEIYARDSAYWQKYLKGRPHLPDQCFERIAKYHADHGGEFCVVHDVGAGVGVQSPRLAKFFEHVIVSDAVLENVNMAEERLGTEKYSFDHAKIEDEHSVDEASIDMVFAAFAMHHTNFEEAFKSIARQLKPGGTFVAVCTSNASFEDRRVEEVYQRMWHEGQRVLLRHAKNRSARLATLGDAGGSKDTLPLDEKYFRPGALRIALNTRTKEWPAFLPPDLQDEFDYDFGPESAVGPNDRVIFEEEGGWGFEADLQFLIDEFETMPYADMEPSTFDTMWEEMEDLMKNGRKVKGWYPGKMILATRK